MLLQSVMAASVGPNRLSVSGSIGEELEGPFGLMPNDLPISAYATTIKIHLRSAKPTARPGRLRPDLTAHGAAHLMKISHRQWLKARLQANRVGRGLANLTDVTGGRCVPGDLRYGWA